LIREEGGQQVEGSADGVGFEGIAEKLSAFVAEHVPGEIQRDEVDIVSVELVEDDLKLFTPLVCWGHWIHSNHTKGLK
jgi:hypothetical protein